MSKSVFPRYLSSESETSIWPLLCHPCTISIGTGFMLIFNFSLARSLSLFLASASRFLRFSSAASFILLFLHKRIQLTASWVHRLSQRHKIVYTQAGTPTALALEFFSRPSALPLNPWSSLSSPNIFTIEVSLAPRFFNGDRKTSFNVKKSGTVANVAAAPKTTSIFTRKFLS